MSEQPNTTLTPDKILTFKVGETDREVKMTYGLLDELVNYVKDINEIATFFVDQETRNKVLVSILSDRTPTGKIITKANLEELDVDLEVIDEILAWAASHVTAFFIRSLSNLAKKVQQFPVDQLEGVIQDHRLTELSNGSKP